MNEWSMGTKLVIWLVFALAMPVVTVRLALRVLDEESNPATFLLIVGYTVLDALAAWILIGFGDLGIWSALVLIAATAVGGFYNYLACAAINKYGR